MNSIGGRIRALRKKAGLTQQELGQKIGGVSASTIGMYEQGRRNLDIDKVVKLCEVFSVSTDVLLGVKEENTDAALLLCDLKEKISNSGNLTLNGAALNAESREKLLMMVEFISSMVDADDAREEKENS